MLVDNEPSDEWSNLISRWPRKITLLRGDVFTSFDLERARATEAVGCFILSNGYSSSPAEEDKRVLRRALALRNYVNFYNDKDMNNVFVQVLTEEYMIRLRQLGFYPHHVTCFEVLRRYLFISTCICPGISTVVQNALTTMNEEEISVGLKAATDVSSPWYDEYIDSLGKELYKLPIGRYFYGSKTADLITYLYEECDVMLICVGTIGDDVAKSVSGDFGRGRATTLDRNVVRSTCKLGLLLEDVNKKNYGLCFADSTDAIYSICKKGRVEYDSWLSKRQKILAPEPLSGKDIKRPPVAAKSDHEVELVGTENTLGVDRPEILGVQQHEILGMTSVDENGKYIGSDRHIVVVCHCLRGVAFMLRALRRSARGKRTIIVLCSFYEENADEDENALRDILLHKENGIGGIHVWEGTSLMMLTLAKVGTASLVIVLAGEGSFSPPTASKVDYKMSEFMDEEIMSMTVDILSLIDPRQTRIVVEMMLDDNIYEFEILKQLSSSMASNKVFSRLRSARKFSERGSQLLPQLVRQSSSRSSSTQAYQVDDTDVLSGAFSQSLSEPSWRLHEQEVVTIAPISEPRMHGSFASGDLVLGTFCESLLVSVFFNPQLSVFLTSFFGALDAGSNDSDSAMISVVPLMTLKDQGLVEVGNKGSINFRTVFQKLLPKGILAFGARKRTNKDLDEIDEEYDSAGHWYAIVCPRKEVILHLRDEVYVVFITNKKKHNSIKPNSLPENLAFEAISEERCKIRKLQAKVEKLGEERRLRHSVDMDSISLGDCVP